MITNVDLACAMSLLNCDEDKDLVSQFGKMDVSEEDQSGDDQLDLTTQLLRWVMSHPSVPAPYTIKVTPASPSSVVKSDKIGPMDHLYFYRLIVKKAVMHLKKDITDFTETVMKCLVNAGIEIMDLRSESCCCATAGLWEPKPTTIHSMSIGILTFSEILGDTLKQLYNPHIYPLNECESLRVDLSGKYNFSDLYLRVNYEDESNVEHEIIGMYKGQYFDVKKVDCGYYVDKMYASSWNYKSDVAITSLKKKTGLSKPAQTVSIMSKSSGNMIWCLGFGW
jgi:hypothetical protein